MDFLKKNWGLLLYSLGCLVLAVVISLNIRSAAIQASTKHKALDEQLAWFESVKKDDLRLTKENERAAQDNRDRAERKFAESRLTMATKYRIDPRSPATPVEAVRKLQEELRTINRMLDEAEPPVDYKSCPYLSFQVRAASSELPSMDDVPKIFRQLRIIKEIASIVAQSHLLAISSIERPMDLGVIEEDLYTATPISLGVIGTADQVQTFINKMTTGSNYLFFLRNITLTTVDQAPNGAIGAAGSTGVGAGTLGMGGPGMEGGMPGMGAAGMPGMGAAGMPAGAGMPGGAHGMGMMDPNTGAPTSARATRGRRNPTTAAGPDAGMLQPGMGGPGGRTVAAPQEPMWRDELRSFMQDALVTVDLRFDLIEFNQPEASQ